VGLQSRHTIATIVAIFFDRKKRIEVYPEESKGFLVGLQSRHTLATIVAIFSTEKKESKFTLRNRRASWWSYKVDTP